MVKFTLLCFFAIESVLSASLVDDLVVSLPDGRVRGTTYVTQKNKTYYGFQGIPYAAPPLGNLRFEAPQSPQPWDDILDATKAGKGCISLLHLILGNSQSEDCLNINVYTPSLKPVEKLPVMLWIYGGKFVVGSSMKAVYGPDFLIEEDVIVVSFNYRVGPFGFLSTGDAAIPGNAGLKDQRLAMKWTHDNIKYFGGDPEKITIFGESAGGASVGLQLVSKSSADLFRAAIVESGNALTSFSVDENPKAYADKLANALSLGNYVNDTWKLKQLLQEKTSEEINLAATALEFSFIDIDAKSTQAWPVIEVENEGAFLTTSPYELLESGQFNQVPIIIGICANEATVIMYGNLENIRKKGQTYDTSPSSLIPSNLHQNSSDNETIIKIIQNMYLNDGETFADNLTTITRYMTDNMFARATLKQAELTSKHVPVYLYQFAYYGRGLLFSIPIDGIKEASHSGEIGFIFNSTLVWSSKSTIPEDLLTQNRMVKLWTNFAKYLNPTPEKSELINVTWPVLNPDEMQFLNINHTLEVRSPLRSTYSEWNKIYETYGRKPLITF